LSDLPASPGSSWPASGFPSPGFADGGPPEGFEADVTDSPESPVDFGGEECRGLREWWLFEPPLGEVSGLAAAWSFALPREWPFAALGFDFDFDFVEEVFLGGGDDSGSGGPVDGAGDAVVGSPAGSGAGADGGCACAEGGCAVG
jgi:hypothetical protein